MTSFRIFSACAVLILEVFCLATTGDAQTKTVSAYSHAAPNSRMQSRLKVSGPVISHSTLDTRISAPLNVCTWTGAVSSAWVNGGNWSGCGGVQPQPGDSVIINVGAPNDPILTSTTPTAGNLAGVTVNSGGRLDISNSGVLNTNANFSLNGGRLRFFFDGTLNVGPTAETNFIYTNGSTLIFVPGSTGSLNIGGRLSPSVATDTITYNQTSGTVRVSMFATTNATFGAFSIPASGSTFQMSGTASLIQREPSDIAQDYVNLAATSNSVTGGTVQFGDGSTTSVNPHYAINSSAPVFNLVLNAITGLRVNLRNQTLPVLGSLTISNGAQLDDADALGASVAGDWINNGFFTTQNNPGTVGLITLNGGATQTVSGSSLTPFHDLTINSSGVTLTQNITVGGTLTLTSGNITTNAGTAVIVTSTGTVSRTSGHIIGNLQKTFTAAANKTFEVGTVNGYSPVDINATAGSFPSAFNVIATQAVHPSVHPTKSILRYWTLTGSGITANLTFHYLAGDVQGIEPNYKVIRVSGGTPVYFPTSSVNPGLHTATLPGATSFSDWTVGEPVAPTASRVSMSGQVTSPDGRPVGGVTVTLNGSASNRTITNASGQYHIDNLETGGFYTVTPGLANYSFSPSSRSFALLGNRTDAGFTASADGTQTENPLNFGDFFVRQQYLDFLGREPDQQGWLFWTEQLNQCGIDANCIRQKRIDISAAFFQSDEFQLGGNYVYRMYRAALGRRLTYAEFSEDRQQVVGGPGLDGSRIAFADTFVTRPEFVQKYQNINSGEVFVDALLQTVQQDAGLDLTSQRESLLQTYNAGADPNHSRSAVLRTLAESTAFKSAVYNASFVLTEYFGYLRRGPDADGYNFWVEVLNHRDPRNYRGMVCSFLTSAEYQERFSSVVVHGNNECGR